MSPDDFLEELYRDFDWRFDEILSLKDLVTFKKDDKSRESARKSVVLVLYSHWEGFCVFALQHYRAAINYEKVTANDAIAAILAGSWDPVFRAMQEGDQKCKIFRQQLPNDQNLHRHWRRRHFIEEIDRLMQLPVTISEDVIDTESNLQPQVLQRNLFLLGLDHQFVEPHADTIHNLLGRRNRIAHGDDRRGVPEKEYNEYEDVVFNLCFRLIEFLDHSFRTRQFVKSTTVS